MPLVALLTGVIIGMIGTALVYADTVRRELPVRTRYLWTGGVGAISIGGSIALAVFDSTLVQLYVRLTQSPVVVQSPRDLVITISTIGLVITTGAVLAYGFGSRVGPFKTA
jgi:hypothetical protein